ncbi:ABC transporter ATP-binding protein/permease, partial [Candidatus Pelagibacter sp.]|nr:ABC transporter ATP-binding protein/permease [Candidatus Pelagibacter sp.]MDA9199966.1 ABC transporter ATP-binding protein/permease [Candidatus Pelagibacter sp.]
FILTPRERKLSLLLLGMILVMALLDMMGVASILPFISVLANPEIIETNNFLNKIFVLSATFGIETSQEFLFFLGIFVFLFLVFSLLFKALTFYTQIHFNAMREYSISKRLVEGFLHQPYSWFLNQNSADLGKTILSEVGTVIHDGIKATIDLITYTAIAILLIVLLIIVSPKISLIAGFTLGITYAIIYKFTRNFLKRIGQERLRANEARFTILSESFGAIKEIKVNGIEQVYVDRFSKPAKTLGQHTASYQIIGRLPRFIIEAVAFGGLVLMILYLMSEFKTFTNTIPIISVYAFAGYRLIPALQQIYASFTALRYVGSSLDEVYKDLRDIKSYNSSPENRVLELNNSITLNNISYKYPNAERLALKNINLNIDVNSTVGFVGTTGSGKTSLVDIILGLFQAQQGSLEVDGQIITKDISKSWRRSIGYVPQHIYLADDTIAANIAFGVNPKNINYKQIENVARVANLHNFVDSELPQKYQTIVGERGIRLSGGQRQRIGIARALYHKPQLLILDEATSALDNLTEKAVIDAIDNLNEKTTIILIAHRLSTIKKCNMIYVLENGEIKDQGTFEKLIKTSKHFSLTENNI